MTSHERELALFPLNLVLFPHTSVPLHIFEQRYRLMVRTCLQDDRTFGVALIKSGSEVGEPAVPYDVGTVAEIQQVERLDDGGLNIIAHGVQRFRVQEILQERPYLLAWVELLPAEETYAGPPTLLEEVENLSRDCLRAMVGLNGEWVRRVTLPVQDPVLLSYLIAARLPLELPVRQRLLEALTVEARLQEELPLLTAERERLRRLFLERMWLRSAELN